MTDHGGASPRTETRDDDRDLRRVMEGAVWVAPSTALALLDRAQKAEAALRAAQEAPAPEGLRLARAIHEGRITVKAHGDFTDRCICNEIARDILRGMAGLVPKPNIENVIADYRAEARPPEGLDAAWAAAEAALPEDWRVGILPQRMDDGARLYRVVALVPEHGQPQVIADGPTPAAALLALASRLSAGGATKP